MRKYFYFLDFSIKNIKRNSIILIELCSCFHGLCLRFSLIAMFNRFEDFIDSPFNFISKDKKYFIFMMQMKKKQNKTKTLLAYCI